MAYTSVLRSRTSMAHLTCRPVSPMANLRRARSFSSLLVTPQEVDAALRKNPASLSSEPRVIPLCASWFLPNSGRTGKSSFTERRVPKARFFDLDKVIDRHSPYPHMLPGPERFAACMAQIGIRRDDTVVVYDSAELGMFSAPRVAWTLRVFGHPKVHVLDNFRLWIEGGFPTESGSVYPSDCCTYPIAHLDETRVASYEEIREVVVQEDAEGVQLLDARPAGRWAGIDPEPREGVVSGHMPGSINIPFSDVLDPETKSFLPAEKLRELFAARGVDAQRPIISTCGTGVTAVILDTALEIAGYGDAAKRKVYDGSWTEWALREQPLATTDSIPTTIRSQTLGALGGVRVSARAPRLGPTNQTPARAASSQAGTTAAKPYRPYNRYSRANPTPAPILAPDLDPSAILDPQAAVVPGPTVFEVAKSSIPGPSSSPSRPRSSLSASLKETEANGNGDGDSATIDWSSSFHGLSATPFSSETAAVLMQPLDPDDVEMKPDGIIYLPEIKYRRILNRAFGPGGWGLAPRGNLVVGEKVVTQEYALIVNGRFIAQARGECQYFSDETIPTAGEGCKSNALLRCCKDLGIASELWDPRFIRSFKKERCHEIWVEHVVSKKRRQVWTRKDTDPAYPYVPVKRTG